VQHTVDGKVVLVSTGGLAGSALTMNRGVENLMRLAGLTLDDAIRLATVNPAKAGRATLDAGDRIQFRLTPKMEIVGTWLAGRQVYGG
jgi:N-acetylglucosamine-6-phosphate deacetylase